ncbi:MAG: signal peptide peptidase SppA [Methanosarcina sp.]
MNDKNMNQEVTNPEEISGDEVLENSAYNISAHNGREPPISGEGIPDSRGDFSYSHSSPNGPSPGETEHQGTLFEAPGINKNESDSLSMSPALSPQNKKRSSIPYLLVILALLAVILVSIATIFYGFGFGADIGTSDKVAVIYVQGTILSGNVPAGLGYATSEEISENIRRALADKNVKAIVLRINSPGGSPAAAQEIVEEIKKAQAQKVHVVVSMGDLAASAAYYISAPTDYIIANPSTSTGSIGVIWVFQNMSASYNKDGIEYYIAKSGEFKDMGGTWRGLTDEEKEYADSVVMESYEDFVTEVSEGRNMTRGDVKSLADGRIYTGSRAKELGLVDDFGNLYDAIDKAAELGGITGEPKVVYMNRVSLSKMLLGSGTGESNETVEQFISYFEESPYGKILA